MQTHQTIIGLVHLCWSLVCPRSASVRTHPFLDEETTWTPAITTICTTTIQKVMST